MASDDDDGGRPVSPKKKPAKKAGGLKTGSPVGRGDIIVDALAGKSPLLGRLLQAKQELMKAMSAKDFLAASFIGRPSDVSGRANIAGFGIGEKLAAGHSTNRPAVRVYVTRKLGLAAVDQDARIPPTVRVGGDEVQTDVVEVGEVVAHATASAHEAVAVPRPGEAIAADTNGVHTGRLRPAFCGASIGHFRVTAGTLGALVVVDGELMILSNNHVLANMNDARKGDRILQPGNVDGGRGAGDVVANLFDFVELDFAGDNEVDAALAHKTNFDLVDPTTFAFVMDPEPVPADEVDLHRAVRKDGRTTGHTLGRVVDKHASIRVRYGNSTALFHDQFFITPADRGPFSRPGDSGSLIVAADSFRPVALLFAGSDQGTFGNPIEKVMEALNIERFLASPE